MNIKNLQAVLEDTFSGNFVSYYRSHVAHVNIQGRNFYADHKLLQKVYEYFQGNIDVLAEKLRTVRAMMPVDLMTVTMSSPIADEAVTGDSEDLLEQVHESLVAMIDQYVTLYEAAEEVNYIDISNFAQDQIAELAKFRWMIESTLDMDTDTEEDPD
jgi:DNA-binding ferritin-like protein